MQFGEGLFERRFTAAIESVADHNDYAFRILHRSQRFFYHGANRVKQMRLAFLAKQLQFRFDRFCIVGPIRHYLSLFVVANDQQLVAFEDLVSKLACSLFQLVNVSADG